MHIKNSNHPKSYKINFPIIQPSFHSKSLLEAFCFWQSFISMCVYMKSVMYNCRYYKKTPK